MKIAVTGHRFLTEIDKVSQGVDRTLDRIEAAFNQPDAIISMLAEGADQLVVRQARVKWPGIDLIVPLPIPPEEYLEDYQGEQSRANFNQLISSAKDLLPPPKSTSRQEAYQLAGLNLVALCDILIAIWDGKRAQGEGGTGEIVQAARSAGKPIAWIHAGNRLPGTRSSITLGPDQGKVSFEGFEEAK